MADFRNLQITNLGSSSVTVPRFQISVQVYDSSGTLLNDFTGANVIVFPDVLQGATAAQRTAALEKILNYIILVKAGLPIT